MAHRILYVSAVSRIAGAENSLLQLLGGLDRRQFAPRVALPGPGPLADALADLDVPIVPLPISRPHRTLNPIRLLHQGLSTVLPVFRLTQHIRADGIELVHAQNAGAMPVAGLAARRAGVPCVWHIRDLRTSPFLVHRVARLAAVAVAVSRAVAGRWRPELPRRLPVRIVPNGIDADAFAARARPGRLRAELGLAPDRPLVVVIGQMVPWKGHRAFLQAMACLRAEVPPVTAAIAGSDVFGDYPRYPDELRRMVAEFGLGDAVRFLGYRTDVPTLLADADVAVVPSEGEPFGRVALEAMALGRPVVGRRLGGLSEVVEDGVTGLLAEGDAPDDLAAPICELLGDPERARALGAAGARRVRERFGLAAHVEGVCAVYRSLLGGAPV